MSFLPKYTITDGLLANIKRINALVNDLNNRRFPRVVLVEFEKTARAVSAYASTSIEGNPLPLTEVKKILKSAPIHIRDSEKEILNYNLVLQDLDKKLKERAMKKAKREGINFSIVLRAITIAYINNQLDIGLLSSKYSLK
mgnify:CR=1 FL=1